VALRRVRGYGGSRGTHPHAAGPDESVRGRKTEADWMLVLSRSCRKSVARASDYTRVGISLS